MARSVRDANLETRAARSRLKPGRKPYWRGIEQGLHIGYRKGQSTGTWVMRVHVGGKQPYRVEAIGTADDTLDADGNVILTFNQAQAQARDKFTTVKRMAAGLPADGGPYTVRQCLSEYLAWLEEHRKSSRSIRWTAEASILPALGDRVCAELNKGELEKWQAAQAKEPARLRTKKGNKQQYREVVPEDADEEKRRRRATANRKLVILKAALNKAWRDKKIPTDEEWRPVKPYRETDSARVRYLTVEECRRLINAADPDLRRMLEAALLTGCRYAELAQLTAADFNPDSRTLRIGRSKSAKSRFVVLTDEGAKFFAELTAGRPPRERILLKDDGGRWLKSHQFRPMREACARAKIDPPVGFHTLRHTWASLSIMNGLPLMVAARNLGHVDTRMVERHYGHLAPSYVADAIRAAAPQFGIRAEGKVAVISGRS